MRLYLTKLTQAEFVF